MSYPLGCVQVTRRIRNNQILRRDKLGNSALLAGIKIHLLKCGTGQRQIEKHLIRVRIILVHNLRNLVIHEVLDALRLIFSNLRRRTNNLRLHRTASRQHLLVRLRLKLRDSLTQQRMMHTTRTKKRLVTLLVIHTKQLQALGYRLFPILARLLVIFNLVLKVRGQRTEDGIIKDLRQVRAVIVHRSLNLDHFFHAGHLNALWKHVLGG